MLDISNVKVDERSQVMRFPLNTRLIDERFRPWRYVYVKKADYGFIPENVWKRNPLKWLRMANYEIKLTDGSVIKI